MKLRVFCESSEKAEAFIEHQSNLHREEGFYDLEPLFEIALKLHELKEHKDDLGDNLAALLDVLRNSGNFGGLDDSEFDTKFVFRISVYDHKKATERIKDWMENLEFNLKPKEMIEVRSLQI